MYGWFVLPLIPSTVMTVARVLSLLGSITCSYRLLLDVVKAPAAAAGAVAGVGDGEGSGSGVAGCSSDDTVTEKIMPSAQWSPIWHANV